MKLRGPTESESAVIAVSSALQEASRNGDAGDLLECLHPADQEDLHRVLEKARTAPGDYWVQFRVTHAGGRVRWISILGQKYPGLDSTAEQKRVEEALAERLAFKKRLAELSTTFINLPPDQVDSHVNLTQRRLCEALGLDRSTVTVSEGDRLLAMISWSADGLKPNSRLWAPDFPWVTQTLLAGQVVRIPRMDDLPLEAAKDQESFRRIGQKSCIVFPLLAAGAVIGSLAFGTLREEREWSAALVEHLSSVADLFAHAFARKRDSEELRTAYCEIRQLKQRLEQENLYLHEEIKLKLAHREVVGDSDAIRRVLKKAEQVAPTGATVLLLGETGTGKEMIARAIHESSKRKSRPMVKVNCAALPATLIESELFGREKGAFTGALTREMGRFELANDSTIFLDEIGELPLELQAKLLRVLQEGEFERLGSSKTIQVDVRVIAATARDLGTAMKQGRFREDLFYRLSVFPITIPPLRERREDIAPLTWHFVNELSQRMGRSIENIHGPTMEAFRNYAWPGNVRELRNAIERILITSTGHIFRADWPSIEKGATAGGQTLEEVERNHILRIMESTGWRIRGEAGAAAILGLKPTTLESRMYKLGISRPK